jgi:hypothetical protein
MKNLIFLLCFFACYTSVLAQESYTINNETFQLKTEVEGDIDLLWNIIENKYRYFVRDNNGNIQELVNTKDTNSKYQEEYKSILKSLIQGSSIPIEDLDLTLYSLKQFFKGYNETKGDYGYKDDKVKMQTRLGLFGGLTNQPFIENPENTTVAFFGTELEIFEETTMPTHTGVFSLKHALDNDDFKYSATQLALAYRFRFINTKTFNIYANVKLATFTASKSTFTYEDPDNPGTFISDESKGSTFEAPFIFGIGSDIKISDNSFITLAYHEIFAVFLESNSNFPMDFAIGYKFNM